MLPFSMDTAFCPDLMSADALLSSPPQDELSVFHLLRVAWTIDICWDELDSIATTFLCFHSIFLTPMSCDINKDY